jgi:hypothetical protein
MPSARDRELERVGDLLPLLAAEHRLEGAVLRVLLRREDQLALHRAAGVDLRCGLTGVALDAPGASASDRGRRDQGRDRNRGSAEPSQLPVLARLKLISSPDSFFEAASRITPNYRCRRVDGRRPVS